MWCMAEVYSHCSKFPHTAGRNPDTFLYIQMDTVVRS